MNTKLVMITSALFLGAIGIGLTFAPQEIAGLGSITCTKGLLLIMQLMGALYFSFAMLNWMAKGTIIGGIYNKPVAIGNFTHFFIGALALLKVILHNFNLPSVVYVLGGIYIIFAILFGIIFFRHPGQSE